MLHKLEWPPSPELHASVSHDNHVRKGGGVNSVHISPASSLQRSSSVAEIRIMARTRPPLANRSLIYKSLLVFFAFLLHGPIPVSGQDQWSGFINTFGGLLNFSCPNNSVVTGIASDFSRTTFDRQWEFRCGTAGGLASVVTSCTLEPAINNLQGDIDFSCPGGGYLSGFRSEFTPSRFDRVWQPYCCSRPASALINCQTPTSRYENDLRATLNFSASLGEVIAGVQSFYFNRDRRFRFQTCQIEVSCGDPGIPANARRSGNRFLYRDTVNFTCEDGYYQSSGPEEGMRECLLTGQWSGMQPVCSQCEVIGACAQVICTNSSDHFCRECESDNGPMQGQRAYTNLGTECQARCSWLRSFCYPGVCPNSTESCDCVDGFQGPNCLQILDTPSLPSCSLVLEGFDGMQLLTLCFPSNDTTTSLFTNILPHQLTGMWQGAFTAPTSIPPRPAYISGYGVGLAVSEMVARVFRAANPNDAVTETTHSCEAPSLSPDNPRPGATSCSASANSSSLSNHTFLHGDIFQVVVRVVAGGFLDIINLDTLTTDRHHYVGVPNEGSAAFTLDFKPPVHCSLLTSPASCRVDQPLLALDGEIVSDGNITTRWGGWVDQPAGIAGYVLTVHSLEESGGVLFQASQVKSVSYNETNELNYEEETYLSMEGAYSFILQTLDNAGNIRYSRRLLFFDNSSSLVIDSSSPLIVTSAVSQTNFLWQNSTEGPIVISGRGHFFNTHLRGSNLLAPVNSLNDSIADEYDHPLIGGRYPRGGTPNALGVVRLQYDYVIDQVGGASPESLATPQQFRFETLDIGIDQVNISIPLSDGDSVRVWFLATDFQFQEINDSVLVHVDSSSPVLNGLGLVRNGVTGLNLHATESFTHLNIEFDTQDPHSGIMMLEWSIGTGPGLSDVGSGNVPVQIVAMQQCRQPDCVCSSVRSCSSVHYNFSPQSSDLNTTEANHDAEYHITIKATNHALLSSSISLVFTVDTTPPLPGAVFDAPPAQLDVDYVRDGNLTGWWTGFFDRESDILFYQYVLGLNCANSSSFTFPLISGSPAVQTTMKTATAIARGEGTYYLTVVAWNAALSPSVPVCSDGVIVDTTAPVFEGVVIPGAVVESGLAQDMQGRVWLVGRDRWRDLVQGGGQRSECTSRSTFVPDLSAYPIRGGNNGVSAEVCFSGRPFPPSPLTLLTQDHTLNVSWFASDNVGHRQFYVGIVQTQNYTGNESEINYQVTAGQSHYSISNSEILRNGNDFYISVRAEDLALHTATLTVGPILIDLSPPFINGSLEVQRDGGRVIITWDQDTITEQEEGDGTITFQYAIGLTEYGNEILSFQPLPSATPPQCSTPHCFVIEPSSLSTPLTTGQFYYFTLSATNRAGLSSFLTSPPYQHSSAVLSSGLVLDVDPLASLDVSSVGSSFHLSDINILLGGQDLGVRWRGFNHPSLNVSYSVSLGSQPGLDDIVSSTPMRLGVNDYVFRSPSIQEGSTYYATVLAATELSSTNSSSNGVLILRNVEAFQQQAVVYDGSSDVDIDYQASSSHVSARWSFPSSLHRHISHYMWGVVRESRDPLPFSGSGSGDSSNVTMDIVREYQNVGKDMSGMTAVSELEADGTRYVNAIRACFATDCLPPVYSDGFQISVQPQPGPVTAVYNPLQQDAVYGTSSSGRLDLTWEEFTGPPISYYEWSLGTGSAGAELLIPWREVDGVVNQVSMIVNVTVSLHQSNIVTLRGYNSAGLLASSSAALLWRVGATILPQDQVPRSPLMVFDIPDSHVRDDPTITSWRDIIYREMEVDDIDYTESGSSLSAVWPNLRYTLYNYSISRQQTYQPCLSSSSIACGSTFKNSVTVSNLQLQDGYTYYFCVQALLEHAIHRTGATASLLEACSNGVTVDLTAPVGQCMKIVSPAQDAGQTTGSGGEELQRLRSVSRRECTSVNATRFQTSNSELYLIWNEFRDVEQGGSGTHYSGVAYYRYAIGTRPFGMDTVNFTSVGVATYAVARSLCLQSGTTYYATIQAVSFVGRVNSITSEAVTIDSTPPIARGLELLGTTQFQNQMTFKWNVIGDEESDVVDLEWGLGTRPGSSDIVEWTRARLDENTAVAVNTLGLGLYDGQLVYGSLKVTNGAGLVSVVSSPGYVLDSSPPEVGVVFDGPPHGDLSYWSDVGVVKAHWRGFNEPHSRIVEYWWAIGSCPTCTDIQPLISVGLEQAGSRSDLVLSPGGEYFVIVRACNSLGLCSQAASNGALLDATHPTPGRVLDGLQGADIQYQPSVSMISAHWMGFHDVQSSIRNFIYYAGSSPNTSDLIPPTSLPADHTSFVLPLDLPLSSGSRVYSTLVAYNRAGLSVRSSSDGQVVDITPPALNSPPSILSEWVGSNSSATQLSSSAARVTWNFTDNLNATMHQYFMMLLSDSGSKIPIPPQTIINQDSVTFSNLSLSDGNSYRVQVIGCDVGGICTSSPISPSVLVDSSPPIDGYFAVASDSVANLSRTVPGGMTWRNRPVRGVSQLNLAFLGFSDPHSGIVEFRAAVGSQFSGSDLLEAITLVTSLVANASEETFTATVTLRRELMLSEEIFISLWAVNGAGLSSQSVQASFRVEAGARTNNGSLLLIRSLSSCSVVSCMGHCTCAARGDLCSVPPSRLATCNPLFLPSLPADRRVQVFNVVPQLSQPPSNTEPLFTSITDQLYGRWELTNSASIQRLEWSVGVRNDPAGPGAGLMDTINTNVWRETGFSVSAVFSVLEQYPVVEGEVYVFYVRAWYNQEEYAVFESQGVTIDVRGPLIIRGRRTREGGMNLRDFDFSMSLSTLSVSWNGVFSPTLSGNYSRYEVGIGRIPGSDDVYRLTPTQGSTVSLSSLQLEEAVVYYSTVRATNPLGVGVTSISDGIMVDTTPPLAGTVLGGKGMGYLDSIAQSETDTFSAHWFGFSDPDSNIDHYELAVSNSTNIPTLPQYDNVGIRLQTTLTGLSLVPGQKYYVHVVAVNRAGLRSTDTISRGTVIQDQRPGGLECEERSANIIVNPSFENETIRGGLPCPDEVLSIRGASRGWSLNTSYAVVATYPQLTPSEGCFSMGIIGSISQDFPTVPGRTYELTFNYRHNTTAQSGAVRVQLPGTDRLISQPSSQDLIGNSWLMARVRFTPTENSSYLSLHSALSNSPVFIDNISITSCRLDRSLRTTASSITWPQVISVVPQVISSPRLKLLAQWDIIDSLAGVSEYMWAIGTVPGGQQLQRYQSTGPQRGAISKEIDVSHGQEVHVSVVAWSYARRQLLVHSGPYIVDLTPPPMNGSALSDSTADGEDLDFQSSRSVSVNWSGLVDPESGLIRCAWAVGSRPGLSDIQPFIFIPILSPENTSATTDLSGVSEHGDTIYSTLACSNGGGLISSTSTDGLTILYQPPDSANVVVSLSSPAHTQYAPRGGYVSTDAVIVWWDGFSEWTGTSLLYEVRLLEEGGMGSEVNWTSVSTAKMVSLRGLQVAENTTAHLLQIRALNLGGVASQPISINISIISVAPLDTGLAINGSWSGDSVLSLDWSGKFISPGPLYYELSVGTQMGSGRIRRWVELSMTQTSYSISSPLLQLDMDYFIVVTAISSSGLHTTSTQMLAGVPI